VRLRKKGDVVREVASMPAMAMPAGVAPAAVGGAPAAAGPEAIPEENLIRAPMVGTFYTAPSPESSLFCEVGDSVDEGQTLCIIEAMKVFNEIPAGVSGQVVAILVENGAPVEFGQPLVRVDPAG